MDEVEGVVALDDETEMDEAGTAAGRPGPADETETRTAGGDLVAGRPGPAEETEPHSDSPSVAGQPGPADETGSI